MRKFNWGYFILGILFIFVSLTSFRDPASDLVAIVFVFAFSAIFKGIIELFFRKNLTEFSGTKSLYILILGIVDIIVGVFLLFNMNIGLFALPYVFAIWFIFDSVIELFLSSAYKEISESYYWFNLIVNILGIIVGFMLLFNPITSALTVAFLLGFYFMVTGITYFIAAF